jgi:hypothetical protein
VHRYLIAMGLGALGILTGSAALLGIAERRP